MDHFFKIDTGLNIPIYRQLVDSIRANIRKGTLTAGQQLPTVQELSQSLGIARGTIKRAYDELERAGLVDKVQGRGTFVSYQPADSQSRKEQAMAAIDTLLNRLEEMGLSPAEINIFLNLKLRERAEERANVKIGLVECNPETLSQITEQLRHIPQVDLYSYLLESVQQYPYKLGEELDLVITTASHGEYIESILPQKKRLARVALRPSTQFLSHVIRLRQGEKVGVLAYSQRFCQLLCSTCQTYAEEVTVAEPMLFEQEAAVEEYLADKDVILLPKGFEKYCSAYVAESLRRFRGERIECGYKMDEGSLLYLEAKVKRLAEEKNL